MKQTKPRWLLVQHAKKNNLANKQLAEMFGVSVSTIRRDLQRLKPTIRKRVRPSHAIDPTTQTQIKRLLHGKANMSTRKVSKILKEKGKIVSHQSVWRIAKRKGLQKRKHRKTFRLTPAQKKKRVAFCVRHQHDDLDDLVFLDECPLQSVMPPNTRNDGTWVLEGEEAMVVQLDKHPLKVSALAAIAKRGKSKLYMHKESLNSQGFTKYLGKIIKDLKRGPFKNRKF